jgi:hypothetical protein
MAKQRFSMVFTQDSTTPFGIQLSQEQEQQLRDLYKWSLELKANQTEPEFAYRKRVQDTFQDIIKPHLEYEFSNVPKEIKWHSISLDPNAITDFGDFLFAVAIGKVQIGKNLEYYSIRVQLLEN